MINNGFRCQELTLDQPVSEKIHILVIADMKRALTDTQQLHLNQYIERGDNLLIAGEPGRQEFMNPVIAPLGIRFLDGQLVKPSENFQPDLLVLPPTPEIFNFSYHFNKQQGAPFIDWKLPMLSTAALEHTSNKGYTVTTLFRSDSSGWNELQTTNLKDDAVSVELGEIKASYPTVLALTKKVNQKAQKILITGDADWLSNKEFNLFRKGVERANSTFCNAGFFWLSDGRAPLDVRREPSKDNLIHVTKQGWAISGILLKWVFSGVLIAISLVIWLRRRGR